MKPLLETEDNRIFKARFSEVYERQGQRLFIAARGIIGNREDAEDVVHHVFAKIVRKIVRGQAPSTFMNDPNAYTYQAVVNTARNIVRWRSRQMQKHVDVEAVEIAAPEKDPEPPARIAHLRVALAKMKPGIQQTLYLFYFENKKYSEIARIRGKRSAAVLMELYRGRKQVKKLIRLQEKQDEANKNKRQSFPKPGLAGASPTGS